ncbi:hypothetical protein ACMSSJ_17220 [Kerstersia gyiorum]|uniref:hypothetical protein n=1 Tax=Kerstersia gyiorum TaxID=206506 RepID=UPI0039EA4B9D
MRIGFIKPNYPGEKRVGLLPADMIEGIEYVVERGFGSELGIADKSYEERGAKILSREDVYDFCDVIFSLKLIQPDDYPHLRSKQTIIGWTHPSGSGRTFMETVAHPLDLTIVDLDNVYPSLYRAGQKKNINWLSRNFLRKNSFYAGFAAVQHSLMCYGLIPDSGTVVAILSPGNVSQGAAAAFYGFNADVRIFYRNTMSEFLESIQSFDVIVNGIELDAGGDHLISEHVLRKTKKSVFIIDAAADAGGVIEGIGFTDHSQPIRFLHDRAYYCINNAPTFYHRTVSAYLSAALAESFFSQLDNNSLDI